LECSRRSFNEQSLDFSDSILHLFGRELQKVTTRKSQTTYPELLVGFYEKVELGRGIWWGLLSRLVVDA
jgi:hypothetical protein